MEFPVFAPILMRDATAIADRIELEGCAMVETRIKPYLELQAEQRAREEQQRLFRRNQVFGMLIVAAAIVAWWFVHTNPKWIFPPGWWRW
jgi:hypothetical protein